MLQNPLNSLCFSSLRPQAGGPELGPKRRQKREQKPSKGGPFWGPFWGPWPRQPAAKKNMPPQPARPWLRKKHAAARARPGLRKKHAAAFQAGRGARKRRHVIFFAEESCRRGCKIFGSAKNHAAAAARFLDLRKIPPAGFLDRRLKPCPEMRNLL